MGIIIERLEELLPKLNRMGKLVRECHTRILQKELHRLVYKYFNALKPLSYKHRAVCKVDDMTICVGRWISCKYRWHKYGSPIYWDESLFNVLREHGDLISRHVRKPIKEAFGEMVRLTKELIPYSTLRVEREAGQYGCVKYILPSSSGSKIIKEEFDRISIQPNHPQTLRLERDDEEVFINLFSSTYLPVIEDLIDDILALLEELKRRVDKAKRHNDSLLKEIELFALPYMVSNSL